MVFGGYIVEKGKKGIFFHVLPQKPGMQIKLVVPTSLHTGWIESPHYFCTVSETGRDVAEQYINNPVGSLVEHKFVDFTEVNSEIAELKEKDTPKELFN